MTNEQSGAPMGRHAQQQPPVNQVASQLSQSLPVVNIEETAPQYTGNPVITLDHVTKIYEAQPNNPALNDISLHIFPGEFVFLVGHSGSGKSTFINLLIRQIKPTKGKIYIADEDLTQMRNWRVPYLRRNIGCVFQDFKLLPNKTVFENVAFALEVIGKSRHVIRTQVPEVLRLVGLQDKMNKRPDQLSGGEQQRVSIARAIVNRPPLLICDEPTGNLDPQNSRGIMDLLERINRTCCYARPRNGRQYASSRYCARQGRFDPRPGQGSVRFRCLVFFISSANRLRALRVTFPLRLDQSLRFFFRC